MLLYCGYYPEFGPLILFTLRYSTMTYGLQASTHHSPIQQMIPLPNNAVEARVQYMLDGFEHSTSGRGIIFYWANNRLDRPVCTHRLALNPCSLLNSISKQTWWRQIAYEGRDLVSFAQYRLSMFVFDPKSPLWRTKLALILCCQLTHCCLSMNRNGTTI